MQEKRELAKVLGATHVVDAMAEDAAEQIVELTGRRPSRDRGGRAPGQRRSRGRILRRGGTATILGMMPLDCKVGLSAMDLLCGKKLQGAIMGRTASRSICRVWSISTCAGCSISTPSSPRRIPLEEINEGFDKMRNGHAARSVIVFD